MDHRISSDKELDIDALGEFLSLDVSSHGLLTGPTCYSNGTVSDPVTLEQLERLLYPGIHVTAIVPPEQGWPIAFYCPICRETTFLLSPWAAKPTDGDYFKMTRMCGSSEFCLQHNIELLHELHPMIEILPSAKRPLVWWGNEAI